MGTRLPEIPDSKNMDDVLAKLLSEFALGRLEESLFSSEVVSQGTIRGREDAGNELPIDLGFLDRTLAFFFKSRRGVGGVRRRARDEGFVEPELRVKSFRS